MIDTVAPAAVDAFGLTDRGLARDGNEDHFLIAHVSKSVEVRQTSLPPDAAAGEFAAGAGYLLAVADGVGGRPEGDLASERTLSAMLSYIGKTASCFQALDTNAEHALLEKLEAVVRGVHDGLVEEYGGITSSLPATTLTLVLLVWPRAYLVQVGDSRAYVRRGGRLQRLTRDQTYGEMMTALGAWTDEQARARSTAETLASAIGGSELEPVVGLIDLSPGDSLLLCTDGLTKHVSDDDIGGALAQAESAEATCRQLVRDALAGGGSDNVTVVVVRTAPAAA
ncbi:MAG TPA: PP2C family serine/threonine-protein phosphatase [Gemmatimonadaceae bacterium]